MSTYGAMIARINDELARPEIVARIPAAILSAIQFYQSERFWFTETEATASTVASQQNYAMPTDFVEADMLTLTQSGIRYPLKRRPWPWIRQHTLDTGATGRPTDWGYYDDQIWLYPVPDQVYTLQLSYLQSLTTLSAYSDTNAWLTDGEELIRTRAMYDLLLNSAHDSAAAAAMKFRVDEALDNLRSKSEAKISTPRLSLDDSLIITGERYNINWE